MISSTVRSGRSLRDVPASRDASRPVTLPNAAEVSLSARLGMRPLYRIERHELADP